MILVDFTFLITIYLFLESLSEDDKEKLTGLKDSINKLKTVQDIITFANSIGLPSIVKMSINDNQKISNTRYLTFEPPSFTVETKYLEDKNLRNNYVHSISYSLRFFLAYSVDEADDTAKDIVNFQLRLFQIIKSIPEDEKNRIKTFNYQSRTDTVDENFRGLKLSKLINGFVSWKNVRKFVVVNQSYLLKLGQLLKDSRIETIKNYHIWGMISFYGPLLSDEFNDYGTVKKTKSFLCLDLLAQLTPHVLERAYIDAINLTNQDVIEGKRIFKLVRSSFEKMIQEKEWLGTSLKGKLIEKLNDIKIHFGFPEWIRNDMMLSNSFRIKSNYDESTYDLISKLNSFAVTDGLEKLEDELEDFWTFEKVSPVHVNAHYAEMENAVYLLSAYLRSTSFRADLPDIYKFATIGYIIGHEITHGFGIDTVRYFSYEPIMWPDKSWKEFNKKTNSMIKQYSHIKDERTHFYLRGGSNLDENIADNGGVREAFYALFNESSDEKLLTGFEDWSDRKMFFLSYANVRCLKQSHEDLVEYITTNVHSPPEYRVNVPLSNFNEFAKAFNCKPGKSKMSLKEPVIVW